MIIYRIFNKIDNKSYIGQSVLTFRKRYKNNDWLKYTHNIILKNAVNKYGIDNFDFEIIESDVDSIEELNLLEIKYAKIYNAYRPNGYNIRGCGDNKFVDEDLKRHLSTFRLGTNYVPNNKTSSIFKGVYWKESKKSWMVRFDNNLISKVRFVDSELEAAEMYDKVALYLISNSCFLNFPDRRSEYLDSDLEYYYNNIFLKRKDNKKDGYFKNDLELLELIKPLIWKMSIPKIAENLHLYRLVCSNILLYSFIIFYKDNDNFH